MCGIAGIARTDGEVVDRGLLGRMTAILAHRGPDGEGSWLADGVGLGHRRLSIIDLETGGQPMIGADGAVAIVFNGEIYNFRELRRDLEARGHAFRTASDTEVILHAYLEHGVGCLRLLRGMFAFAIWDARCRRLFLARDRVGIKPLVYAWDGRRLLFASEIKSILEAADIPRALDHDALRDYLTFNYVPGPRTIFRAIRKLPPASYLVLEAGWSQPRTGAYWRLEFAPDEGPREEEWLEGLAAHLDDAVRSHLVSDVPVGAFLSGGLDSSTVVAHMARVAPGTVRTFSIGFDEAGFDELEYARAVSRHWGTDHYEFVVKPDALEALPRLAWQLDEPFADSSAIPTYYVSKITREHVTVALSGDGGDENFAGYGRYAAAARLHERLDRSPLRLLRPVFRAIAALGPPGARGLGYLDLLGSPGVERYFRMVAYHRDETLRGLLTPEARAELPGVVSPAAFRALAGRGSAADFVSTLQHIDIATYLPDDILTKVDLTSMLVSLETRVPLLDHLLMEYLARIPSGLKLRDGRGKSILKRLMADRLPPEVLGRAKMGFAVPMGSWLRGELGAYARDVLLSARARQRGIFDPEGVAAVLDAHGGGRVDRSSQIWALLCFEEWARRWLDR